MIHDLTQKVVKLKLTWYSYGEVPDLFLMISKVFVRTLPPAIEAPQLGIMSSNLTVYHPNISTHTYP